MFWEECVQTTVYIINRLPSKILDGKSLFAMLHGREASIAHPRVFGCLCYATNLVIEDKFAARARRVVHMRYSTTQKGYRLCDLTTKCFFLSMYVSFRESEFPFKEVQQHLLTQDNLETSFLQPDMSASEDDIPTVSGPEESSQGLYSDEEPRGHSPTEPTIGNHDEFASHMEETSELAVTNHNAEEVAGEIPNDADSDFANHAKPKEIVAPLEAETYVEHDTLYTAEEIHHVESSSNVPVRQSF